MKKSRCLNIMVFAMLCSLIFAGSAYAEALRTAEIGNLKGTVEVLKPGADWQAAELGMMLSESDEIRTMENSFAEILIDDKGDTGRFEMNENTRMRLNSLKVGDKSPEKITLLDVAIGKVMVYVEKLEGDSKFEVRTPTGTMGVRGTVFEVIVEEKV